MREALSKGLFLIPILKLLRARRKLKTETTAMLAKMEEN